MVFGYLELFTITGDLSSDQSECLGGIVLLGRLEIAGSNPESPCLVLESQLRVPISSDDTAPDVNKRLIDAAVEVADSEHGVDLSKHDIFFQPLDRG